MSLTVVHFPEMGPQRWPVEGHKHCIYKYKHTREVTYAQRNEDMNTSANNLAASFLLRRWYGHARTLLPDITTHSCMPQAFAISSTNQTHISHIPQPPKAPGGASQLGTGLFSNSLADFHHLHPFLSPHGHPKTDPILLSPPPQNLKLRCRIKLSYFWFHQQTRRKHDKVRQKWPRPRQHWIKMIKSCWHTNEIFSSFAITECHLMLLFLSKVHRR